MNIRVELLKLQENASLLDRAEFAAKFMTIAAEYHRLQLLQQTQCTTKLPSDNVEYVQGWKDGFESGKQWADAGSAIA
jgi:hypothetical protein